ncbi:MAG: hypothetical protein EAZ15_08460 [Sphingobacteriales bacterium]|nr:MAG: hypothetical protein EAZ15_08460 [Sphingobacteriales bacterium]
MYRKIKLIITIAILFAITLTSSKTYAQFTLNGQLRTRGEHRNGFANLIPKTDEATNFISQRTRLNFGYKWDRVTFGVSVQDIRVWGQDASTISPADGNKLMLHEGWADITLLNMADTTLKTKFIDNLSLKIGRQELIYDDSRLIGNLDWLQQGRRFDMALLKAMHHGWALDIGYAFNQNSETFTNTFYTPGNTAQFVKNDIGVLVPVPAGTVPLLDATSGNSSATGAFNFTNPAGTNATTQNYKNFISVYLSKKFNQTKVSALYFNDDFTAYNIATRITGGGNLFVRDFNTNKTVDRYTYGGMITHTLGNASGFGKIAINGAYYHQLGKDRDSKKLDAYHYTASATYSKGKFTAGPGYDYLSGNTENTTATETKRFDPLYGTPHKFWGLMDYFYAPTGSPSAGLKNAYFKTKFTANRYSIMLDYHYFEMANSLKGSPVSTKKLGDEVDLTVSYNLNKFTTVDLGYSVMLATDALAYAKGQVAVTVPVNDKYEKRGQFAYFSINIKPDFFFTKPVAIKN